MFYLTYKGACSPCSGVSWSVELESDGAIEAITIESFKNKFKTEVSLSKPSLVEVQGTSVIGVCTGPAMSLKILKLVGPQKAMRIFSTLASEMNTPSLSRRSTLAGFATAAGLALTGASWSPAVADDSHITASEKVEIYASVTRHPHFLSASRQATKDNYSQQKSEYVVIRHNKGYLFFYFMEHNQQPKTDAAVISCFIEHNTYDFSLEYLSGSVNEVISANSVGSALKITRPSGYEALPMGPAEYFSCIAFCVGANCGVQATRCRVLIHMAAVLACMTAICGSKVKTCHNICRQTW